MRIRVLASRADVRYPVLAVLTVASMVTGNQVLNDGRWSGWWTVAALLSTLALCATTQWMSTLASVPPSSGAEPRRQAWAELGLLIGGQAKETAAHLGLLPPIPLGLTWDDQAGGARRAREVTGILDAFRSLSPQQLVITGSAASGKTSAALLLAGRLFDQRASDDRIAVILSLNTWDPDRRGLDDWLIRELEVQFPAFFGPGGSFDRAAALNLLTDGRLVPVLDGLDELGPERRVRALKALRAAVSDYRPFVLTSRTGAYHRAIAELGAPLPHAAVARLDEMSPDHLAAYLPGGQPDGARRWASVLAGLERGRPALVRALRSPLMAYLARAEYSSRLANPDDLTRFDDAHELEKHLLKAFLPAVYGRRSSIGTRGGPAFRDVPSGKAERWLRFLARHSREWRARDRRFRGIGWWLIEDAVPGWLYLAVAIAAYGGAAGLLPVVAFGPLLGVPGGIVVGLLGGGLGVLSGLAAYSSPSVRRRSLRKSFRLWREAFLGTVVVGAGIAFVVNIFAADGPFGAVEERRMVLYPLIGWLVGALLFLLGSVRRKGGLSFDAHRVPTGPGAFLAIDRRNTIIEAVMLAAATGPVLGALAALLAATAGASLTSAEAFVRGLVVGCGYGLAYALVSKAWGRWMLFVRILLPLARRLPFDVMSFLGDAQRRGVLRQVGVIYQYRHTALAEALVEK